MQARLITSILFPLLVLCMNVTGCASTPTTESLGEYTDDSIITTKVKSAIVSDPTLKATEINVETFKGVVQLSGFVTSQNAINNAVQVAKNIKGVKEVRNKMELKVRK